MKNTSVNVGLIGYKFMGKVHSNAFRQVGRFFDLPYPINMHSICGRDERELKSAASQFGWSNYETSWEKVVSNNNIDIIDITTPSNIHKDIAIAAANNGKHVFCEKPLAITLEHAREMLEAVTKNGVNHQIGFNYRFAPAIQLAKNMIISGKLGKIYHVRASYLQDFICDPNFPLVWRLQKNICGSGSLGDLGAHFIDLARFLVGEFRSVSGMSRTFINERPLAENMAGLSATNNSNSQKVGTVDVDDGTVFIADFECGALGTFEATRFAQGHKNDLSIEINGEKGSIKFMFERMNELLYYNAEDEEGLTGFRTIAVSEANHPYMNAWWPTGHVIGYEHTFIHEMYEFLIPIFSDVHNPTIPNFNDGVKCSQILQAVELSIQRKSIVNIQEL